MKSFIIAVLITALAILAIVILGDFAISSRVSKLEGKQATIDQNLDRIMTAQDDMDEALKDTSGRVEENSQKIQKNRELQETLSTSFEESRNSLSDRIDQQGETDRSLLKRLEGLEAAKDRLSKELEQATDDRDAGKTDPIATGGANRGVGNQTSKLSIVPSVIPGLRMPA